YHIKDDVVKAQYSPDLREYISNQLFETRINEFNTAIQSCALAKGLYLFLYLFTTFLVLVVGVPITKSKADRYENYSEVQWMYFLLIVMCVYVMHLLQKMREVEKVMVRINNSDIHKHIFWKLDFTDKYMMEGYRKKYYETKLANNNSTSNSNTSPITVPSQQIVVITGNATTLSPSDNQTTRGISIDASQLNQLNQILAVNQQQQHPPQPPAKY
ncbi:7022_t:CDS:2, partial [Funneliformis mosseae]